MKRKEARANKVSQKNKPPSLVKEILVDILVRHWFLTTLSLVAIASAMLLAKTSHEVRRATAESQELREARQQQEINWQALRLEMTSLSEANRISSKAKKELDMIKVTISNEKVITL